MTEEDRVEKLMDWAGRLLGGRLRATVPAVGMVKALHETRATRSHVIAITRLSSPPL
jgi:hypothetical protein